MKVNLEDKVKKIAEEIIGTKEFAAFQQANKILERNSRLKSQVEEFFRSNAELQECKQLGKKSSIKPEEIKDKYARLMQTQEIANYFKQSQKFHELMMEVHGLIDETINRYLENTK